MHAILLPLDGSDHARAAIPVARSLALLTGAALRVVHVGEALPPPRGLGAVVGALQDAVLVTRAGDPAAAILEEARDADMVVMCAHAGHAEPGPELGRVAGAVLRDARCPVVVVPPARGEAPWSPRLLLLPQDGSPEAASAAEPAARLCARVGGSLLVVHVVGDRAAARLGAPAYIDQEQHEWPAWQAEFLGRLACRCAERPAMRLVVAAGNPAEEVLRAAREAGADLVVLAWGGSFEGAHAATMRGVLAGATCPVMVVRAA
ncbi:MAG: universal stress protein [Myxococcota bacterium]